MIDLRTAVTRRRAIPLALAVLVAVGAAGCADSDGDGTTASVTVVSTRTVTTAATGPAPPAPTDAPRSASGSDGTPQAVPTDDPATVPTPATDGGADTAEVCRLYGTLLEYEGAPGSVVPEPVAEALVGAIPEAPGGVADAVRALTAPLPAEERSAAFAVVRGHLGPLCA